MDMNNERVMMAMMHGMGMGMGMSAGPEIMRGVGSRDSGGVRVPRPGDPGYEEPPADFDRDKWAPTGGPPDTAVGTSGGRYRVPRSQFPGSLQATRTGKKDILQKYEEGKVRDDMRKRQNLIGSRLNPGGSSVLTSTLGGADRAKKTLLGL